MKYSEKPVVVNPEALSKKLLTNKDNGSIFSILPCLRKGFTYINGKLPNKLNNAKLKTMTIDVCLKFIGVYSP